MRKINKTVYDKTVFDAFWSKFLSVYHPATEAHPVVNVSAGSLDSCILYGHVRVRQMLNF